MKRFRLDISYNGSMYDGFQRQPGKKTIQGVIELELSKLETTDVKLIASGRTDAKVHALHQVAHVDLERDIEASQLQYYCNRQLPNDIWIKSVSVVDNEFHARHDVRSKRYRYLLNMGEHDPFRSRLEWQYHRPLKVELMQQACSMFIGEHHFGSFTIAKDKPSYLRTIKHASIKQIDNQIIFEFEASGFMRYMIRMMVGSLVQVGAGRLLKEEIQEMLDSAGNKKCIYKAPPEGLYLVEVHYETSK